VVKTARGHYLFEAKRLANGSYIFYAWGRGEWFGRHAERGVNEKHIIKRIEAILKHGKDGLKMDLKEKGGKDGRKQSKKG